MVEIGKSSSTDANKSALLSRLFGFLLGSTLSGAAVYYYILEEYRVSNSLLTEDIYVRFDSLLLVYQ